MCIHTHPVYRNYLIDLQIFPFMLEIHTYPILFIYFQFKSNRILKAVSYSITVELMVCRCAFETENKE